MKQSPVKLKYQYGFHDQVQPFYSVPPGLSRRVVEIISSIKNEPTWMTDKRLRGLEVFAGKPMPTWGANLTKIDFHKIQYYIKPTERQATNWRQVPGKIKNTFIKLGIPQAEQKFLAGVGAQYESEMIYHNLKEEWSKLGVIFSDMDTAVREHTDIVKKYFGTVIPVADNKFASLNTAVWSGGSFVYVPAGVKVTIPLQAYFRLNASNMGQFERTLIIAEEGSFVNYVEGCTAPIYSVDSLHAAVVEVIAHKYSRVRYTTMQNWSTDVYNLVTKRAVAEEGAVVEWVDGNFGSKITMKYPSVILKGEGSRADILSIAMAGAGQNLDAGAKVYHLAKNTSSKIVSKSVSHHGGHTSYRGLVKVIPGASNSKTKVQCDALLLDKLSRTDTYPTMQIYEPTVQIEHEATVSKIGDEQLFYLRSRGLTEAEAVNMIISGFIEPVAKELPMEYALELNRLIALEMEGSVG